MVQLRHGPCVTKGSHRFTCHPHMNLSLSVLPAAAGRHRPLTGTHRAYPRRDGQAELSWVAGYIHTRINVTHRELNCFALANPFNVINFTALNDTPVLSD